MSDDFDRSPGGLIAAAMQSTAVTFVIALASLAAASLAFSLSYQVVDDYPRLDYIRMDDVVGGAVFALVAAVPWSFMRIWGIPVALFQVYCFYAILYEEEKRPQRAVWLFFGQLVAACVGLGGLLGEWKESLLALLLSGSVCGLPFVICWLRGRSVREAACT